MTASQERLDQLSVRTVKCALSLEQDGFGIDEVVSAMLGAVMALVVMPSWSALKSDC